MKFTRIWTRGFELSSDSSNSQDSRAPNNNSKLYTRIIAHRNRIVDLAFVALMIVMIAYYLILNSIFPVPIRDGIVFMINAHEWLDNTNLLEIYRPPLFSWIIDAIWVVNGEDWTAIKYVQMVFTIASVILLYILLRKRKGALFAFGVSALTLTNAQLFFYTSQILTEGISLFFLILTLYFFEGTKKSPLGVIRDLL